MALEQIINETAGAKAFDRAIGDDPSKPQYRQILVNQTGLEGYLGNTDAAARTVADSKYNQKKRALLEYAAQNKKELSQYIDKAEIGDLIQLLSLVGVPRGILASEDEDIKEIADYISAYEELSKGEKANNELILNYAPMFGLDGQALKAYVYGTIAGKETIAKAVIINLAFKLKENKSKVKKYIDAVAAEYTSRGK